MLKKITSNFSWQFLVIAKLALIVGIWVSIDDDFQFGDKSLKAEDAKEVEETQQENSSPSVIEADPAATQTGEQPPENKRTSFLSNLLNLPDLNPDNIRKEELGRFLELAERKKRQVEDRLALLTKREEKLIRLEKGIDAKLMSLDEERRFFAQSIQREKDLKGERLDKLILLYSKMEPKKAAPVFEKLDKDLVVSMFKVLPQKQVTLILETMAPDKSVEISEYYGRIRSGREYDLLKEMNTSLLKEFEECKGLPQK